MSEQHQVETGSTTPADGLLDPAARAVAGLALAVVGLMGQNLVQVGTQVLLVGGGGSGGPQRYFARAAVVVALVGMAGAALMLVGGLVTDLRGGLGLLPQ